MLTYSMLSVELFMLKSCQSLGAIVISPKGIKAIAQVTLSLMNILLGE